MSLFEYFLAGTIGACLGSFLNVCIHRIPLGISLVRPGSFCPHCGAKIKFYHNIPILSYIYLRGRCKDCGGKISKQYPLVELLGASVSVLLLYKYGLTLTAFFYLIFCSVLLVIGVIDLKHKIIPDILSLGGMLIGILASFILQNPRILDSILGVVIGGGGLFLIGFTYEKLRKIEGLGGGDIKLLAMIGAWLGYKSLLCVLLFASVTGLIIGGGFILLAKKDRFYQIPFGPFLAGGAMSCLFI